MELIFIFIDIFVASNLIVSREKEISSDGMAHCIYDTVWWKNVNITAVISVEEKSSFEM